MDARVVPTPEDWFALLLHGFDREQGLAPRPSLDCSGSPVVWQEPQGEECREAGPEPKPLPPEKLTEEDLVLETVRADTRLVWVVARRFDNGEGLGPVGLVERTPQGFVVRALGSLRAYPRQSRLRLEQAGSTTVLVAEGEVCTDEAPAVCRRMARVLPLRQGRFFSEAVVSSEGACLGPAWFPLSREQVLLLPGGLQRKVEFTSTLAVKPEGIVLDEQVVMHELDPNQASMPPLLYRRAQAQRVLAVKDARLVGTSPSLWVRLMEPELLAGAKVLAPPQTHTVELAPQAPKTAQDTP
ncbi:hypothetical protein [Hyalangium rubrum]|uniref:Lipoprotein n=1 Tax=Hyalangium rubrum TaxID=3103134 RepID=A0ABU5H0Y3_9BACT|nr:hypothetical protein [Hyalangium sp. s54d21]MDY7225760.1 hypothetical protein [Hyalangium sp. s54d21]